METKTQRAISLYQQGKIKASMALFSRFKIGFSPEQRRVLQMAYECTGDERNEAFYTSIGVDVGSMISQAHRIIKTKYNI